MGEGEREKENCIVRRKHIHVLGKYAHRYIGRRSKRRFRSTEGAIRTTNENWGCENHVNDDANAQIDREEIILIYEMCIIGQFITNPIDQEKLNMKNKNQFMFQNGG